MSRLSDFNAQALEKLKAHPQVGYGLLVAFLVWFLWPVHYKPRIIPAAEQDQPFAMKDAPPTSKWRHSVRAQFQSVQDRLDVTGISPNFILSVQMEKPGSGRLSLENEAGESLRELFSGPLQAGTWAFRWDGTGEDTLPVAPGHYQIHWQHEDQSVVQGVQISPSGPT